ncbi:MAG: lysophospholipid acyltransferase family protein [Flavobacteriaceae bacterium]|nr:lysophospholipid acyltransferase family protein [Flavobacteriaceae bacterium]
MMYLISYIILYPIIMLMSRLPFWVIYCISDILYFFTYYIIGYRKKVVFDNLRLVFPEKSEKEITKIAKDSYLHFGDILMETIKAFSMSDREFAKRYRFLNLDIFEAQFKKNKSVAMIGSHYGNWEWFIHVAQYTSHTIYGTYNTIMNPYFDELIRKSRERFGGVLVPTNETIPTIIQNTENQKLSIYGLLSDQSPMVQKAIYWNKFMGVKVPIHTGAEVLAKKYNLAVVYFSVEQIKRGYYEITLKTLADDPSTFKNYEITDQFLKLVEEQIKRKPSLYFWTHRRWKHKDKAPLN